MSRHSILPSYVLDYVFLSIFNPHWTRSCVHSGEHLTSRFRRRSTGWKENALIRHARSASRGKDSSASASHFCEIWKGTNPLLSRQVKVHISSTHWHFQDGFVADETFQKALVSMARTQILTIHDLAIPVKFLLFAVAIDAHRDV